MRARRRRVPPYNPRPLALSADAARKLAVCCATLALCEALALGWLGARFLRERGLARLGRGEDALRREAELLTEGPYAVSDDPVVGYELKRSFAYSFHDALAHVDADGLRRRAGPERAPDAPRVLLVGDSVAFGYGVLDDETYAAQLEQLLAGTLDDPAAAPVVRTLACPGWNHRSSLRKLRTELARLAPDVVLYLAVNNDLDDATTVTETGQRRVWVDPAGGLDRPQSSTESFHAFWTSVEGLPSLAWAEELRRVGRRAVERVLASGLTPESLRRWDALVQDVLYTRARVASAGGVFAVVLGYDDDFERRLDLRLAQADPELPVLGLFTGFRSEDTLVDDPHPNPRCVRAGALRMARFLIERGWIAGARAERLPPQDERYDGRAWERPGAAERERWQGETDALLERFLEPEVDLARVVGIHQVYGGVQGDGTVARCAWVALRNRSGATRVQVELVPVPGVPDPLLVRTTVGERLAATTEVAAARGGEAVRFSVALLPEEAAAAFVEVRVTSERAVLEDGPRGRRLAAFRLHRIGLE